jgi:hypothetical protein
MSDDNNDDGSNANGHNDSADAERGIGDYTSYLFKFSERCAYWTASHVTEKRYPAVQAAIILEVGIRNSEGLEKAARLEKAATE